MTKNIWQDLAQKNQEDQPFFILAPMEAVTDTVFRQTIAQAAAPDLWFTEFTNATGWVHAGQKAIGGRLFKEDFEKPIVAQIWGGEPGDMQQLAEYCQQLGFNGIDINMGCPAKSALKSGGSALIRKPELAAASIQAAKTAGLPVSIKTRLGYTKTSEWQDWLGHVLKQDVVNLTIHLRTKKEMSKVPAHYELIDDIVKLRDQIAPQTLLTINGDIEDYAAGMELYQKHPGVNGIMVGRGIFHNPFAFCKNQKIATKAELLRLLEIQLDLFDKYQAKMQRPFETLKRFFKIYVRDFDGAKELRDRLMHCRSTNEVREILQEK